LKNYIYKFARLYCVAFGNTLEKNPVGNCLAQPGSYRISDPLPDVPKTDLPALDWKYRGASYPALRVLQKIRPIAGRDLIGVDDASSGTCARKPGGVV